MSDSEMGNSNYERSVVIDTADFSIDVDIEVDDSVDHPELLADRLQDHLDECLLEFVVSEGSNNHD